MKPTLVAVPGVLAILLIGMAGANAASVCPTIDPADFEVSVEQVQWKRFSAMAPVGSFDVSPEPLPGETDKREMRSYPAGSPLAYMKTELYQSAMDYDYDAHWSEAARCDVFRPQGEAHVYMSSTYAVAWFPELMLTGSDGTLERRPLYVGFNGPEAVMSAILFAQTFEPNTISTAAAGIFEDEDGRAVVALDVDGEDLHVLLATHDTLGRAQWMRGMGRVPRGIEHGQSSVIPISVYTAVPSARQKPKRVSGKIELNSACDSGAVTWIDSGVTQRVEFARGTQCAEH